MVYKATLFKGNTNGVFAVKKPSEGVESKVENEIRVLSCLRESPHVVKLVGTSQHRSHFVNPVIEREFEFRSKHHSMVNIDPTHYLKCQPFPFDDHIRSSILIKPNSTENQMCAQSYHKLIVMELMPNGSLHHLLHEAKTPPTWPTRIETAMQIARAIGFLHEGKVMVIHRDIKSSNILFDSQMKAKLADFGLAVIRVDPPSQPAGTIGYLDPSYTTPCKLSTKNDIFSFGVLLLEMISGRKAIDVCKSPSSIVEWAIPLIQEKRVLLEEICDSRVALPCAQISAITGLLRYAARCVSSNEDDRPSARELVMGMQNCLVELEPPRLRMFPINWIWTRVLKRLRKRISAQTHTQHVTLVNDDDHVSSGKLSMTIKEVLLADELIRGEPRASTRSIGTKPKVMVTGVNLSSIWIVGSDGVPDLTCHRLLR
ncbi:hypothetical protein RJT34_13240 [Clitoria ternatea]|uniref:Protein kinase domain-containing protein n=1 Tax=Clitoria ternatea TaxID=43366 RepID=A0AAN9JQT2_CLITE